jgi:hypothetical protein
MLAYEFTGFMLLANNIILIGFHVLTGAKVLNTLSDHSLCTVVFSVIVMLSTYISEKLVSYPSQIRRLCCRFDSTQKMYLWSCRIFQKSRVIFWFPFCSPKSKC